MDNSESYNGYITLSKLYEVFNETEKSDFYKERAKKIKDGMMSLLYKKASNSSFDAFDYAYNNSSYNRLFFDRIYYPNVLCQIFPILHGVVDPESNMGKHLYFLHTYYAGKTAFSWYNFDRIESNYPHIESLYVALMFKSDKIEIDHYSVNISNEIETAIKEIIKINNRPQNEYYWNVAESGNLLKAIELYMLRSI